MAGARQRTGPGEDRQEDGPQIGDAAAHRAQIVTNGVSLAKRRVADPVDVEELVDRGEAAVLACARR